MQEEANHDINTSSSSKEVGKHPIDESSRSREPVLPMMASPPSADSSSSSRSTQSPFWQDDADVSHASSFTAESIHTSFWYSQQPSPHDAPPAAAAAAANTSTAAAAAPADKERQLLLLMLLAQVCALHDPTPRTFTVHVLELFERGILDRDSIRFLFDLGLVPQRPSHPLMLEAGAPVNHDGGGKKVPEEPVSPLKGAETENNSSWRGRPSLTLETLNENGLHETDGALVVSSPDNANAPESLQIVESHIHSPPNRSHSLDPSQFLRTQEASAIRTQLAHQETRHQKDSSPSLQRSSSEPPSSTSWAVEHHPLSLSRYQREFESKGLLNSGAFGHVYCATNKMDGLDYAIKRVAFSASGYSNESVTQVVREVLCLAQCDHPNCVRYYTAWLEPSWMTGSGTASETTAPEQQRTQRKLLTDIHHMVLTGGDIPESIGGGISSSSRDTTSRRRFSWDDSCDESFDAANVGEYSEWTIGGGTKDDSFVGRQFPPTAQRKPDYRYQICLYIQMQLCRPTTLADWIRERNCNRPDRNRRAATSVPIFAQIVRGIEHVHSKGILHRDLKPANVFVGEDGQFKIGDFGLSKLLKSANGGHDFVPEPVPHTQPQGAGDADSTEWKDPLTAGIGTASYAAPEQIESRAYGPEADVFSLGLILLELFCSFATEHERIRTFRDCRHGTLPSWLSHEYPDVSALVVACTNKNPERRPTASSLLQSHVLAEQEALRVQLLEKDKIIAEKDRIIDSLRQQVKLMSANQAAEADRLSQNEVDRAVAEPAYGSEEDY